MIDRRELIKWGAFAPALLALPGIASAKIPQGINALLLDKRLVPDVPPETGKAMVLRFSGDVTRVWYNHIEPRWRWPGFVLAGITGSHTLFTLEMLGVRHGRRVVARRELDGNLPAAIRSDSIKLVSWIIAPVHPSVIA